VVFPLPVGLPMSVTLDDRVHGTKGAVSLTAVKTLNGSTATVVPNSSGLSFTFTADQPETLTRFAIPVLIRIEPQRILEDEEADLDEWRGRLKNILEN